MTKSRRRRVALGNWKALRFKAHGRDKFGGMRTIFHMPLLHLASSPIDAGPAGSA